MDSFQERMNNMETTPKFIKALNAEAAETSVSVTENGALGYARTEHRLTDFFFKIGSMRKWTDQQIISEFLPVYAEDKERAIELLFFLRDCRGGLGERRVFEVLYSWLVREDSATAAKLIDLIPEYGSWKTFFKLTPVFAKAGGNILANVISKFIKQWLDDHESLSNGSKKSISLMAKWLPSLNASSKDSRRIAKFWYGIWERAMREKFGLDVVCSTKAFRKEFVALRKHLNVVEQQMSAGEWGEIDYNKVPGVAGSNYRNAFMRHDTERRKQWLSDLATGKNGAKINTTTLTVTELVHKYFKQSSSYYGLGRADPAQVDGTIEAAWKDLVEKGRTKEFTEKAAAQPFLPVIDGSGSMYSNVTQNTMSIEIAMSLGLYFSAINSGYWRNHVMSFGSMPEVYCLPENASLLQKLITATRYNDCGSTDIERVFDLVLSTAIKNDLPQEEIPALIIFSDMEFNGAMCFNNGSYYGTAEDVKIKLFTHIAEKYRAAGYKLPKLYFWNICGRTNTLPIIENDLGLGLISGYSQQIADMVVSKKLDPYGIIIEKLDAERYDPVRKALAAE